MKPLLATALLLLASLPCAAQSSSAADAQLRDALDMAARGHPVPPYLASHPAYVWVEFAALRRSLDTLPVAQGQAFLDRHASDAVGGLFRAEWLAALHKRSEWAAIRAAWSPDITDTRLRCIELDARQRLGAADAAWNGQVQEIWRQSGKSLPDQCDGPFQALAARGALTPELRWERLDLAAAESEPGVMRAIARGLPEPQRALAEDYAAYVQTPDGRAAGWPRTARSRLVASHGLARLGKDDPDAAEALLPGIADALGFDEAERSRVLYQIALWTVASYLPDSARRLAAVPDQAYDERLHEWRVREALARSDWPSARAAISRMGPEQRGRARWSYFAARLDELLGKPDEARALYAHAATEPDFHGFLAADRLGQPYPLCPATLGASASELAHVANDPAMVRAMALYRVDRPGWAIREWNHALARFNDRQRRVAVQVAQDNGWYDRAVFGLGRQPEERQFYTLRFPLHHDDLIRRNAAEFGVDPAWIAAEIRAESTFNPNARSPADARGLMQVLPATGAAVARRLGMPWRGGQSLYDPATNLRLGTAYLQQMKEKYDRPYVAIAAYNAGPTPTARWQSQRPGMDADFWIETVSYYETREYIARVLAFSVIYDWRLDGSAAPLSERMEGRTGSVRKAFECPAASGAG